MEIRALAVGAVLLAGCASAQAVAPLQVTQVVSAHHGKCPKASNAVYGAKAAQLFAAPLPYNLYHCMSWTQAQILESASCARDGRNTIFVTLAHPPRVLFEQDGHTAAAVFTTFGAAKAPGHETVLYVPVNALPRPPLPRGVRPYRGPVLYSMFGLSGDPFDLERAECLTA